MAIYDDFLSLFLGDYASLSVQGQTIYLVFGAVIAILFLAFIFRMIAFFADKLTGR